VLVDGDPLSERADQRHAVDPLTHGNGGDVGRGLADRSGEVLPGTNGRGTLIW
jgi:hypothetical protein